MSTDGRLTICQISDIHCGSPYFVPDLLERSILEINDVEPTAVVVSGDLTDAGYRQEFEQAAEYVSQFRCENLMVIPGNHDSRNVGYIHFERLFGERYSVIEFEDAIMVGVDSSEPDLNDGRVGREYYGFIRESFEEAGDRLKIFVVHHHLIPIPGTGRERNIIFDAGDLLELLTDMDVGLVLSGHKHVPHSWRIENMFIVNAGTASTTRLRGNTRPCYNVIEIENGHVQVFRKYPFKERELIVDFNSDTNEYSRFEEKIDSEISGPLADSRSTSTRIFFVRALFLIDGEHYPPVVLDAMKSVEETSGTKGVAAAFLGGTEKLKEGTDYGVPLVKAEDPISAVEKALREYEVDVVVDLSDEPVVGYRERMRIASLVLAAGARYRGSDFDFRPPEFRAISEKPSLAVIGTGKRVGKTAVSGYLARLLSENGFVPGVVSMGRGGPPEPVVIEGHNLEVGSAYLLEALEKGMHAASDYYETAALSRVVTVGCRRCGGGLAGEPFVSNVLEGAKIANDLGTGLTVFDGSGAAVPPVEVEGRVLVAGAHQDPEYVTGFLGAYRLLISDLLLLTMSEEPMASEEKVRGIVEAVRKVKPGLRVIPTVFRPRPVGEIRDLKVAYVSTAPGAILEKLSRHLEEEYGCEVVGASGNLSDRKALRRDLEEMRGVEAYLTEIKAAAVDVVTRRGAEEEKPVFYCDNDPVSFSEDIDGALLELARDAVESA